MTKVIDTHTHLDFHQFDADRDDVIYRAKEADVAAMITIGIDRKTSEKSVQIATENINVFAAVGVHPHDAGAIKEGDLEVLRELAEHPKTVAIGEIGLDYYRNLTPPETQRKVLKTFLEMAKELDKPVIIHTREADDDIIAILKEYGKQSWRGVFHCFSGDVEMAKKVIDMGFLVSFTGNITFKKSTSAGVAAKLPLEKLMVETDCPFMAPVPNRGKRNEPAFVQYVAQKLAELHNKRYDEIARITTENAINLFGLTLEAERE